MRIYLIAPTPSFGKETLVSDKVLNIDEPYALMASAGITTVAALLGEGFDYRLCDELIEDVDFDDPAEVIGISMNVAQVTRGIEIARRFKAMGRTVIVGGPHVSLAPEVFEGEADCMVVGEFETVAEDVRQHMTRKQLADGAIWLVDALLEPDKVIRRFEHLASLLPPPPEHLLQSVSTQGIGASGMFKLIKQAARNKECRRAIEAVHQLSRQRPEIARDLSAALAAYLNMFTSVKGLSTQPRRAARHAQERQLAI